MAQLLILGFIALVMCAFLTWPVRKLAIRIGAMDAPNLKRKTQGEPVPYLGGVSVALTISFLTYVAVLASDSTSSTFSLASFVLIPALFMGAMGLVDDLKGLPPIRRLGICDVIFSNLFLSTLPFSKFVTLSKTS